MLEQLKSIPIDFFPLSLSSPLRLSPSPPTAPPHLLARSHQPLMEDQIRCHFPPFCPSPLVAGGSRIRNRPSPPVARGRSNPTPPSPALLLRPPLLSGTPPSPTSAPATSPTSLERRGRGEREEVAQMADGCFNLWCCVIY